MLDGAAMQCRTSAFAAARAGAVAMRAERAIAQWEHIYEQHTQALVHAAPKDMSGIPRPVLQPRDSNVPC